MSTLHLVRHGQASFLSDNYDQLSPVGFQQARKLGEYWVRHGARFDRAVCGPRRRHLDTAGEVVKAYAEAGLDFPPLEQCAGFDEFQADELVAHSVSALSTQYGHVKELHDAYLASVDLAARRRSFQKFMEAVTLLWAKEDFETPSVEPWSGFCGRVRGALQGLVRAAASGSRIVVFTSGGPAAVAVQCATDMSAEKTLELIWTLRNAALVEFLFSGDRFTLSTFNTAPYLDEHALWTYR